MTKVEMYINHYFTPYTLVFFETKINYDSLQQVRIVPQPNCYVMEVVYESVAVKLNLSEYDDACCR